MSEISIIGADYGPFSEYIFFDETLEIVPHFKASEFSTSDEFIRSIYDVKNIPKILNISCEQSKKKFLIMSIQLEKYGILSECDDITETLLLKKTKKSIALNKSPDYSNILKFSGNILLKSDIFIENTSLLFENAKFENAKFVNDHRYKIYVSGSYQYDTKIYICNTYIPSLELKNIANIWISKSFNIDNIKIKMLNKAFIYGDYCSINISPNSIVKILHSLEIDEVNCLNIGGNIYAGKDIFIKFTNKYGEFDLKHNATIVAQNGEISISHSNHLFAINKGVIAAKKIYYSSNILYNNGVIITNYQNEPSIITVNKLFNYKEGKILFNILEIETTKSFYNTAYIGVGNLILDSPNSGYNSGIIYNNGNITTDYFEIKGKTYFLNNKEGIIYTNNKLDWHLNIDFRNIDMSKGIINFGHIYATEGNVDLNYIFSHGGKFFIKDTITGKLENIICISAQCSAGLNLDHSLQIFTNIEAQSMFWSNNQQNIKYISIGVDSDASSLPAIGYKSNEIILSDIPKLDIIPISSDGGFLQLSGKFIIEAAFLNQKGKIIFGDNVLSSNDIIINSLFMSENSVIVTNRNGHVFVSNMVNHNGIIKSFGNLTIDQWSLHGTITFEGNIKGPEIKESIDLILNKAQLAIDGDIFHNGLIRVIGDSVIIANSFIQSGIITGEAGLKIKASEFVMKTLIDTVTKFVSNHEFIEQHIVNRPKIDLAGAFELDIDKIAVIDGSEIKSEKIKIKAGGKVVILPTSIYKRVHQNWGRGHRTEESINLLVAELTGEKGIEIISNEGIIVYSGNYKSEVPIILNTKGEVAIEGVSVSNKLDYYDSWVKSTWWGAKKYLTDSKKENHLYPVIPIFSAGLYIYAEQGLSIIGVKIESEDKSEFIIGKEGMNTLAKMLPMMEIHLYDSHFSSKKTFLGIKLGSSVDKHYHNSQIPHLNLISSTEGIKAYIYGSFVQIGTSMIGNNITIEATKEIYLSTSFAIEYTSNFHESYSLGNIEITLNDKECSIGINGKYTKSNENILEIMPLETIYQGNLHLIAPQVNTIGISGKGGIFIVEAEIWNDSPAEFSYKSKYSMIEGEIALKLGIKSSFGGFVDGVTDALEGIKDDNMEGYINAGFASYASYLAAVQILAAETMIKPGVWVELSLSTTKERVNNIRVIPSQFNYVEVNVEVDKANLVATQINAYNAYIKAKEELKIFSAKNINFSNQQYSSVNVDIALTEAAPSGFGLSAGQSEQYSENHLHFRLNVENNLYLHVLGKASIKGATISANSLDASFGELILESVKDLLKSKSMGVNFGLSINKKNKETLSNMGGQYSKGLSETITEITSIIGKEKVNIVVAHALHLNGAMIANAARNSDGSLTDLGNLQILAGQLFVQHIYQHDEGIILGASIKEGRNLAGEENNAYRSSFGIRSGDGWVKATIGKGEIISNNTIPSNINRNIDNVIEFDYDIDLKTINLYYQERDKEAEEKALEAIKDPIGWIGSKMNNVGDVIKNAWEEITGQASEVEEEIIEEEIENIEKIEDGIKDNNRKLSNDNENIDNVLNIEDSIKQEILAKAIILKEELLKKGLSESEAKAEVLNAYNYAKKLAYYKLKYNGLTPIFAPALAIEATKFALGISTVIVLYIKTSYSSTEDDQGNILWIKKPAINSNKAEGSSTSYAGTSMPDPDDFEFEPDEGEEKERFRWQVKDPKDADKVMRHEEFGKFYRDPTQKIGNKDIWWTKDNAEHAGSKYKLYIKKGDVFEHVADLDENGLQILKHKGKVGDRISVKKFIGVK